MDTDASDTTAAPGFDPFSLDDGGGGAGRGGWHLSSLGWIPPDPATGSGYADDGDDDFLKQRTFQPGSDAPWPGGDGGAARPATLAPGDAATAAPARAPQPKPASGISSPEDGGGGWVYYDPSGNDDAGMDKASDTFSNPYHMQPGYGAQQGGRNGNGADDGQGGLNINSDFTRPNLPPVPNGTFVNVPGDTLGSNSGNYNDYTLNNPRPLGISMDTGTGNAAPPGSARDILNKQTSLGPEADKHGSGTDVSNAKFGYNLLKMQPNPPPVSDERTEKNISTLLPRVQALARQHLYEAQQAGIDLRVLSGSRTYPQQDALYAQGRTVPGSIVTNARGGYSNHNFGTAYDVGVFTNGGKAYLDDGPEYDRAAAIGKRTGLEWGGDWKTINDRPHFQFTNGLTLQQMRDRVARGQPVLSDP